MMLTTPKARTKAKDRGISRPQARASQQQETAESPEESRPVRSAEFSTVTHRWHSDAPIQSRRELGQFMTPRHLRETLLDHVAVWPGMRVLDPGVGTGEFLRAVLDREPEAKCFGWDVDSGILGDAAQLVPEATLSHRSALDPYVGDLFDLVIGNPPYFQFRPSRAVREQFDQVISGRPNIFALFFQAGLSAMTANGKLAFVVPPSMNNGAYFEGLREYVTRMGHVEWLRVFSGEQLFDNAQTAVQLIVVGGGPGESRHVLRRESPAARFHRTIFAEDAERIAREFVGRPTLFDLGFEAVTGAVVWNQHREKLAAAAMPGLVPLLWAQNIVDGKVVLHASERRPQYVRVDRALEGPAIIVNRIVGAVGSGVLRCALVPEGMSFVGENHVNVIRRRKGVPSSVLWTELLALLSDDQVGQRVVLLTGNTQVSATELTHLLPLGTSRSLSN